MWGTPGTFSPDCLESPTPGAYTLEGSLFSREYEGDEPVRDAQEAVRKLRADGVSVCALFYGASAHLDEVHQIYGNQYVRIKTLSQLPDGVCELLGRSLAGAGSSCNGSARQ